MVGNWFYKWVSVPANYIAALSSTIQMVLWKTNINHVKMLRCKMVIRYHFRKLKKLFIKAKEQICNKIDVKVAFFYMCNI